MSAGKQSKFLPMAPAEATLAPGLGATTGGLCRKELWGGETATTNNRMETNCGNCAIEALKRPVSAKFIRLTIRAQRH